MCLQLDVCSLFKFRQINLRAMQLVASLHEYQVTISHGLNPLCALLRTQLGLNVTLSDFYDVICTKNCALCSQFGGFVFLPTWVRCCFECLREASETRIETLASVKRRLRLTRQELSKVGSFRPLPGVYSLEECRHKLRARLVSIQRAILVSERGTVDKGQGQTRSLNVGLISKFRFMASCALPFFDIHTGIVEHGISCAGCQLAIERDIGGARGKEWVSVARDKVYSPEGFLEHFKWCEQAQFLYDSSENGTIEPTERPYAARKCGFFKQRE